MLSERSRRTRRGGRWRRRCVLHVLPSVAAVSFSMCSSSFFIAVFVVNTYLMSSCVLPSLPFPTLSLKYLFPRPSAKMMITHTYMNTDDSATSWWSPRLSPAAKCPTSNNCSEASVTLALFCAATILFLCQYLWCLLVGRLVALAVGRAEGTEGGRIPPGTTISGEITHLRHLAIMG